MNRVTSTAFKAMIEGTTRGDWLLDSGASRHMAPNDDGMTNVRELTRAVELADNHLVHSTHIGDIRLQLPMGQVLVLEDVLIVPKLSVRLISTNVGDRYKYCITSKSCEITDLRTGQCVYQSHQRNNGTYGIKHRVLANESANTVTDAPATTRRLSAKESEMYHKLLGHVGRTGMTRLLKHYGLVPQGCSCVTCSRVKAKSLPFPKSVEVKTNQPLERIHFDIGDMGELSHEGKRYFLIVVDDYTRYMAVVPLSTKSEAQGALQQVVKEWETKWGSVVKEFHSDNGSEFTSKATKDFIALRGAIQTTSIPNTPQQNGVAERAIQTVQNMSGCLREAANMPIEYWVEAMEYAAYLKNINVHETIMDVPFRRWNGRHEDLKTLHVFGCICYAAMPKELRPKAAIRAYECVFLGIPHGQKGYKLLNLETRKIFVSRDVRFEHGKIATKVPTPMRNARAAPIKTMSYGGHYMGADVPSYQSILPTGPPTQIAPVPGQDTRIPNEGPQVTTVMTPHGPVHMAMDEPTPATSQYNTPMTMSGIQTPIPMFSYHPLFLPGIPVPYPGGMAGPINSMMIPGQTVPNRVVGVEPPTRMTADSETSSTVRGGVEEEPESVGLLDQGEIQVAESEQTAETDTNDNDEEAKELPSTVVIESELPEESPVSDRYRREKRYRTPSPEMPRKVMVTDVQTAEPLVNQSGANEEPVIRRESARLREKRLANREVANAVTEVHDREVLQLIDNRVPRHYGDAINRKDAGLWKAAMMKEKEKFDLFDAYEEVDRTPDMKVIPGLWVFDIKTDANNSPIECKARYVVDGSRQRKDEDFSKVFAPTTSADTIRLILSLAADLDLEIEQSDVMSAFLHAECDSEVYIEIPPGFGDRSKVWKLKKAVYGLKQSPKLWYDHFVKIAESIGFERSAYDQCLFVKRMKSGVVLMIQYVDDLLIISKRKEDIEEVKEQLGEHLQLKALGPVNKFLNINVTRNRHQKTILLSQEHYLDKMMKRYDIQENERARTPLPTGHVADDDDGRLTDMPYREALGSVNHAAVWTRPDLAHAVSVLSKFMAHPKESHWELLRQVLKYINGTKDIKLTLGDVSKKNAHPLGLYSDADWGGDLEDRKSRSGSVALYKGGPVTWKSKKQTVTAGSTAESEYIALSDAVKSLLWIKNILEELGVEVPLPMPVYEDNQACEKLVGTDANIRKIKHLELPYHHVRDLVSKNIIEVNHCKTNDMAADMFTKSVGPHILRACMNLLSLMHQGECHKSECA